MPVLAPWYVPVRVEAPDFGLALVKLPDERLVEPLYELASDPAVTAYMEWNPHRSVDDSRAFFDFCAKDTAAGTGAHFGVCDDSAGAAVLGVASLLRSPSKPDAVEATRWLGRQYWGRGVGHHLLQVLLELALGQLGLSHLYLRVAEANLRAQRSIVRLGIPREAVEVGGLAIEGKRVDCVRFGLSGAAYARWAERPTLRVVDPAASTAEAGYVERR